MRIIKKLVSVYAQSLHESFKLQSTLALPSNRESYSARASPLKHSPVVIWRIPQSKLSFRWKSFAVSAQRAAVLLLLEDSRRSHERDRTERHESASGEGCATTNMLMFGRIANTRNKSRPNGILRIDGAGEGKCSIYSRRWVGVRLCGLRLVSLNMCSVHSPFSWRLSNQIAKQMLWRAVRDCRQTVSDCRKTVSNCKMLQKFHREAKSLSSLVGLNKSSAKLIARPA